MRDKLHLILIDCLKENIENKQILKSLDSEGENFKIMSNCDSLTLVSILVDFEAEIQDEFGLMILISSDRAMSERGPFYDIQSLLNFTQTLINEELL